MFGSLTASAGKPASPAGGTREPGPLSAGCLTVLPPPWRAALNSTGPAPLRSVPGAPAGERRGCHTPRSHFTPTQVIMSHSSQPRPLELHVRKEQGDSDKNVYLTLNTVSQVRREILECFQLK